MLLEPYPLRILVVEDDLRMAGILRQGLTEESHTVTLAADGRSGLSLAETGAFDVMLLDAMLPGIDGWTVLRRVREAGNRLPILMLTARDATSDIVGGLNLGADDYLTKPFSLEILFARVRALGRRGPMPAPVTLQAGALSLHQGTREVTLAGHPISLTRTEYAILELLMRNAPRVVTRGLLLESVWGGDAEVESNTVDAFIHLLRLKIESPGGQRLLRTVRGVGYALQLED